MKKLIHVNKTLKSTYTLKTQRYLYILCLLMLFRGIKEVACGISRGLGFCSWSFQGMYNAVLHNFQGWSFDFVWNFQGESK